MTKKDQSPTIGVQSLTACRTHHCDAHAHCSRVAQALPRASSAKAARDSCTPSCCRCSTARPGRWVVELWLGVRAAEQGKARWCLRGALAINPRGLGAEGGTAGPGMTTRVTVRVRWQVAQGSAGVRRLLGGPWNTMAGSREGSVPCSKCLQTANKQTNKYEHRLCVFAQGARACLSLTRCPPPPPLSWQP